MIGRLVHSADFKRLLATPMRSRSAHFAVHHVVSGPHAPSRADRQPDSSKISTGDEPHCHQPVDDLPTRPWVGSLIPKRHARRAVTRSLLKRQVRAAMVRHESALAPGLWLVRLRAPFSPQQFPAAASQALRAAARGELEQLLQRAVR